ncbi:hypothetical protein PCASD_17717 [Puccinia coronata f. sp. avenae]|uniref:Uncharacterized protein n=2 Tax=Puccinia coronata f. sp. avenae TaxID=200324 RepID=A0A2N5T3D1_9BASI|nr:hypothetical protein PCASD_17717 [Puccinia coronata f. sp. avenae]
MYSTLHVYGTHTHGGLSSLLVLLHQQQMRVDYLWSPSRLFNSETSLLDLLYKALSATSLSSVCLSNPKPLCVRLSVSAASRTTTNTNTNTPAPGILHPLHLLPPPRLLAYHHQHHNTQGKHTRDRTQRSSISYPKSYFRQL